MGTYYAMVNHTKRQRYVPAMGEGNEKFGGFIYFGEEIAFLLITYWHGDHVELCSDSGEGGTWDKTYDWPAPLESAFLYTGAFKVNVEHNGMTKLMRKFVESFGAEAAAVALDSAITQAKDIK